MSSSSTVAREVALRVVQRLREHGYVAYWAGGCVRDALLGLPSSDYDVATSATPQQVVRLFGRKHTRMVGAAFGVVLLVDPETRVQVEIATFRTDASYSDGRHPDAVRFSTPEEDAKRRDFTINGMFYDPLADRVIDYVGGQADLRRGIIRAIGDPEQRIDEDKLRMLRAVRFAARFRFEIEPVTLAAIQRHAAEITRVAPERIGMELQRMLSGPNVELVPRWLQTSGLLRYLFPELHGDGDIIDVACRVLHHLESSDDWVLRLAGMYSPLLACPRDWHATAAAVQQRFRLSHQCREKFAFLLDAQDLLQRADHLPWSTVQPLVAAEHGAAAVELLAARVAARVLPPSIRTAVDFLRRQLSLPPEQLDPPPLLDGHALKDLGIPPGPHYQELLRTVRQLQLDGVLTDREQAIAWVQQRWRALASSSPGEG
ncbi:MAG: cytidine(C)-cytidine(C)-adenosine (A)]-adding enzyme [Pirellulaceae bacterium]|nr:MAG: cytidine(C)-cytidine(C)-adenosine (A)]-adding enzyme [Pirellulaceae bacterium]